MQKVELDDLMLPINIIEEEKELFELPTGEYALGRDGLYLHNNSYGISSFKKIEPKSIVDLKDTVAYSGTKVDVGTLAVARAIFKNIYDAYKTEAMTLLHKVEEDNWYLRFPEQHQAPAAVTYELTDNDMWWKNGILLEEAPDPLPPLFGTIHSHSSMRAFFSVTDDKDHQEITGLHIVMGSFHVDRDKLDVKARVCGNGLFGEVEMDDIAERGTFKVKGFTIDPELIKEKPMSTEYHTRAGFYSKGQTTTYPSYSSKKWDNYHNSIYNEGYGYDYGYGYGAYTKKDNRLNIAIQRLKTKRILAAAEERPVWDKIIKELEEVV